VLLLLGASLRPRNREAQEIQLLASQRAYVTPARPRPQRLSPPTYRRPGLRGLCDGPGIAPTSSTTFYASRPCGRLESPFGALGHIPNGRGRRASNVETLTGLPQCGQVAGLVCFSPADWCM